MALYVETGYVTDEYTQDSVSIDWGTSVIFVPKTFLTLVQATPIEIYNLDLNEFRLKLKDLEAINDSKMTIAKPTTKADSRNNNGRIGVCQSGCILVAAITINVPNED